MKRWLVEETGEIRCPKRDEYFLNNSGQIDLACINFYNQKYPIFRITEIHSPILSSATYAGKDTSYWLEIQAVMNLYNIKTPQELVVCLRWSQWIMPWHIDEMDEMCDSTPLSDRLDEWNW